MKNQALRKGHKYSLITSYYGFPAGIYRIEKYDKNFICCRAGKETFFYLNRKAETFLQRVGSHVPLTSDADFKKNYFAIPMQLMDYSSDPSSPFSFSVSVIDVQNSKIMH